MCLAQTLLYVYPLFKLICYPLGSRRRWCTSSWPCGCLFEPKPGFLRIILLFLFGHNSSETADSLQSWHQRSVSPEAILQECKVRFLDFFFFFPHRNIERWAEIILPQRICIHGSGLVLKQPATSRKNRWARCQPC